MNTAIQSHYMVLIPAYNATTQLSQFLPNLLRQVPSSQICIVIDGNDPATENLCKKFSLFYLIHPVNRGKGAALQTGFNALKNMCQWIITMDADGQHSPLDLPSFINQCRSTSASLLIGKRQRTLRTMPLPRIISNTLTSTALSLLCRQPIADSQCGYRAYKSSTLEPSKYHYTHFEFESEILLHLAYQKLTFENIAISTIYGDETSNISHIKDTLRWMKAVIFTIVRLTFKGSSLYA